MQKNIIFNILGVVRYRSCGNKLKTNINFTAIAKKSNFQKNRHKNRTLSFHDRAFFDKFSHAVMLQNISRN